jgi:multiple sugar transport system ATP-binding protein
MKDGRVEQIGDPLSLYDSPANVFVAGFLGSPAMNLLVGRLEPSGAGALLLLDGDVCVRLPVRPDPSVAVRNVIAGVRPEHLLPARPGQVADLEATVSVIEPTGADTLAIVRLGTANLNVLFRNRVTLAPGETVPLCLAADCVHLFDAKTGTRIVARH